MKSSYLPKARTIWITMTLVVSALLLGVMPSLAQTGATFTLTPSDSTIDVDQTVTVVVAVDTNGFDIDGASLKLTYNPAILEVVSTEVASSQPLVFPISTVGATNPGSIIYAHLLLGGSTDQNFDYVEIEFKGIAPGTSSLTFDPSGADGSQIAYLGTSQYETPTNGSITVNGEVTSVPCVDISELDCDEVPVSIPFSLDWDADESGLDDNGGVGTGFTMVMAPSARLAVDVPVYNSDVPGYEPSKLNVDLGSDVLEIEATKGIFYYNPSGTSPGTNSQINGLGVGLIPSETFEVTTTIINPAFNNSTGNNSQQAGVWFGLDEDHVIKLVVAKTDTTDGKIQLQVEDVISDGIGPRPPELDSANISNITSAIIHLRLVINTTTNEASGFYSINNGPEQMIVDDNVSSLPFGAHFLSGVDHDSNVGTDNISFAGVHSTLRNAPTSSPTITFQFDDFSIGYDTTPPVITLVGDDPLDIAMGNVFSDPGATAIDDFDGDISGNIVVGGDSVDTNTGGSYEITYDVLDAAGNAAVQVTRTVNVVSPTGTIIIVKDAQPDSDDTFSFTGDLGAFDIVDDGDLFSLAVNFQLEGTTLPNGYEEDYGQEYGLQPNNFTYGWISVINGSPISLENQARTRATAQTDLRLESFVHMNHPATPSSGYWEVEVPNGVYEVTVAVGEPTVGNDPEVHRINAEGVNIVDDFVPSGSAGANSRHTTGSGITIVTDGKLTIDYLGGGNNTKIDYIEIDQISAAGFVTDIGTYDVIESATSGWALDTLTCSDASATSVGTATASIDLAEDEVVICTFTNVEVIDDIAPVITLIGDSEVDHEVLTTYVDAGATATDDPGAVDISGDIVIDDSAVIDTVLGSYTVTFNVTDGASNAAVEVTRTVNVVDTTPPVITLTGDATVELTVGATYDELGATANDNYDGNISGNVAVGGDTVDINTIGSYTVTYDVSDSSSNAAVQVTRTVNVSAAAELPVLVINEIIQNPAAVGDNAGEWFEIYNPSETPVDIDGWTVSDDGSDDFVISGPLEVPALGYLVLGVNADTNTNGGVTVDYEYSGFTLGNGDDEVVLLDTNLNEIDRVNYDGGPVFPDPNGASMALISPELDNNVGSNWCESTGAQYGGGDYGTPGAANDCGVVAGPTEYLISEIQGSGATVTTFDLVKVSAIVVGDYQGGDQLSGFFIQEEDADADGNAATSEGIFVYCGSCADAVAVGDLVEVVGTPAEFFGMSQIAVTGSNASVTVISSNNTLPTAATIDLPAPAGTDEEATFESVEGMLVSFNDTLVVSEYFELARFGHIVLTEGGRIRQFTDESAPSVAGYAAHLDDVASRQIFLDDDNNTQNAPLGGTEGDNPSLDTPYYHPIPGLSDINFFRGGDSITGLTGIMHWSYPGFGDNTWRIRPVPEAFSYAFTSDNPRTASPDPVGGSFKVASFNVLNYFQTLDSRGANSAAELQRQTEKIVDAICEINADVVGLIEIENDGGTSVDALLSAINAECGTYAGVNTGVIGTDEIAVAFIYKTSTTTTVGSHAILDSSVDANFIDTKNRPALAQTFEETATGGQVTVVVNHLKSKGSACDDVSDPDLNDGQANCNLTRTAAAQAIADWLATDPTSSGDDDYLIIGDLNAYRNEDPITTLETAGYTDLIDQFQGASGYTYVFDGQLGYLDYALANGDLLPQVTGVTAWHINADEIPVFDYNDHIEDTNESWFTRESTSADVYEPDAYRSSDHDPVIVGLNLTVPTSTDATLIGTIDLQGRADESSNVVAVTLYTAGTNTVVTTETVTTNAAGNFTITGLTAGTYDIGVKHPKYLQTIQEVVLADGSNSFDFGELLAGDSDNDNDVDSDDYAILSASFGLSSGDTGYDDRADFNGDESITIFDFTLLSVNYELSGDNPSE